MLTLESPNYQTAAAWNKIGEMKQLGEYINTHPKDIEAITKIVSEYLPKMHAGDQALDLGCGEHTLPYIDNGFSRWWDMRSIGVDFAFAMLQANPLTRKVVADATTLPFPTNTFRLVTSFFCFGTFQKIAVRRQPMN